MDDDFITDKELISEWLDTQLKRAHKWRPLKSNSIDDLTGWNTK